MIINAHEAEAVRLIFDMVEQNYSYTKIADYLNGKGYRTKGGKPFSKHEYVVKSPTPNLWYNEDIPQKD